VVDTLLVFFLQQSTVNVSILAFSDFLPNSLCLLAIAWGTIRTISTGDILNPRILGARLKRSVHVEG
jgi:hypothetical protein